MTDWDWKAIGKERQNKYQEMINNWDNTVMYYREGTLELIGLVEIKTDDWGVKVKLNSEQYHSPITLSAAWEILYASVHGMSAAYVNWRLSVIEG